jgi:carbohydrate diacid regulator
MLKKIAQNIAESASGVIGREVLVTDENGIIIGCSDRTRLGDLHGPSVRVMKEGSPAATSIREAAEFEKVKPGYTLPIQLFDKVTGSISIAGLPEDVSRYGQLVEKQAEIMLREQAYLESSFVRERAARDLVESIASYDDQSGGSDSILMQAKDLGCSLDKCFMALVFRMTRWGSGAGETVFQTMVRELRANFSNPRNLICPQENYNITVFFSPSGGD